MFLLSDMLPINRFINDDDGVTANSSIILFRVKRFKFIHLQ